jgi:hypothetical protein
MGVEASNERGAIASETDVTFLKKFRREVVFIVLGTSRLKIVGLRRVEWWPEVFFHRKDAMALRLRKELLATTLRLGVFAVKKVGVRH